MNRNEQLFERAQKSIPGGVNSPVRAFRSVGGTPLFIHAPKALTSGTSTATATSTTSAPGDR